MCLFHVRFNNYWLLFAFILQWVPEITHHCQKTPFLLVGTQIDLREDASTIEKLAKNKQKPISLEQGEKLAKELKAVKYVECSALTQVNYLVCNVRLMREYLIAYLEWIENFVLVMVIILIVQMWGIFTTKSLFKWTFNNKNTLHFIFRILTAEH